MTEPNQQKIVTLIGGGGFIGRYAAEALLKHDLRLRIAERNPKSAHTLQPLSKVGQIALMPADLSVPSSMERVVTGADAVVNFVGTFDTGKAHALHVEGAGRAARFAKEAGAKAFVHISALGVGDTDPEDEDAAIYARTKAAGEKAVREAFPQATILRPSTVFGSEDEFTNRFAGMMGAPVVPILAPDTKFQPVFVRDLGQAVAAAALDPVAHGGKTYEIAGPEVMTMREINERIADTADLEPNFVELPDVAGGIISFFGFLPMAPLTRDQWKMLQHDNVATGNAPGLEALGVTPTPFDAVAVDWLGRYKPGGRFAPRRHPKETA